jgi:heat shock protein HslJ
MLRALKILAAFAGLGLALSTPAMAQEFAGSTWKVVEIAGKSLEPSAQERTRFEAEAAKGRLATTIGCNRMAGGYKVAGESLSLGPLISTRMACPGELDTLERAYMRALQDVRGYKMDGGALLLLDAGGRTLVRLVAG